MNQDQFLGIIRAILPAGIAYAVGKGWLSSSSAADVSAALIALAAAGWSIAEHTDSAKLAAVEAMPDVRKIVPSAMAAKDSAVGQAAADSDRPKISA